MAAPSKAGLKTRVPNGLRCGSKLKNIAETGLETGGKPRAINGSSCYKMPNLHIK